MIPSQASDLASYSMSVAFPNSFSEVAPTGNCLVALIATNSIGGFRPEFSARDDHYFVSLSGS